VTKRVLKAFRKGVLVEGTRLWGSSLRGAVAVRPTRIPSWGRCQPGRAVNLRMSFWCAHLPAPAAVACYPKVT